MSKIKNILLVTFLTMFGAVHSFADVTFDSTAKTFSGDFDLSPFLSAVGIIVGAIAVIASIRVALSMFRRV